MPPELTLEAQSDAMREGPSGATRETPTSPGTASLATASEKADEPGLEVGSRVPDTSSTSKSSVGLAPGQLVAPDLVPLVQQQLEALANQTFAWQGQVWPGQQMKWEIEEDGHRNDEGTPDEGTQWQTRLALSMPLLGEVRATLRLRGGEISLLLSADDNAAATRLAGGGEALRTQFESAGLTLSGLSVGRHERAEG